MVNKIFLDANIFVDFINESNVNHNAISFLIFELKRKAQLFCSPTTFSITYYFLSKKIKNNEFSNGAAIELFSNCKFTREDYLIMEKVQNSKFRDLEDALQYFSAADSGIDIIITYNFFDFEHSQIPVYHPIVYINEFLL